MYLPCSLCLLLTALIQDDSGWLLDLLITDWVIINSILKAYLNRMEVSALCSAGLTRLKTHGSWFVALQLAWRFCVRVNEFMCLLPYVYNGKRPVLNFLLKILAWRCCSRVSRCVCVCVCVCWCACVNLLWKGLDLDKDISLSVLKHNERHSEHISVCFLTDWPELPLSV